MKSFRQDHCCLYCSKTREWQDETKKEKHHKGSTCRFEGRWKAKRILVCLFPSLPGRSSPNNRAPSSGHLPKGDACLISDWQDWSQAGSSCKCPARIFQGKHRPRVTQTGHPWPPPCCWLKGFWSWTAESWRDFRKAVSLQSPFQQPVSSLWYVSTRRPFSVVSWVCFDPGDGGKSVESREAEDGVCVWSCGRGMGGWTPCLFDGASGT